MIKYLNIKNYALIENLEIDFVPGYTTITGETGAGKSILMGALSLILGKRADTSVLLKKDQKCIVEGEFYFETVFKPFFDTNELDFEQDGILRREILPGGKSRAFINDTPVNLNVLKDLGDQMVDIHSQHQSLQLKDHIYQLNVVDYVSENMPLLRQYQDRYETYMNKKRDLSRQKEEISRISGELDFYQYQFDELAGAKLKEDELSGLEEELNQLEHAEEIKQALQVSAMNLSGEDKALSLLNEALQFQKKIAALIAASEEFATRLDSAYIELKDVAAEMNILAEKIEGDPDKLQQTRERIDLLYSLMQKHKQKDLSSLIEIRDDLYKKIEAITFSDENIRALEKELATMHDELIGMAEELHTIRTEKAVFIEKHVRTLLLQLGIPNASFNINIEKTPEPGRYGMDDVRFLFSANKQAPAEEISKVASGGEVSRLMLSLKSLLTDYKGLPTLIFDEIDAGVSGEIADRMGGLMKEMSKGRQVIAITHLPQVASQGDEHFLVYKQDDEDATATKIRKLTSGERVTEIAKLLSGEKLTEAAISNARELLKIS